MVQRNQIAEAEEVNKQRNLTFLCNGGVVMHFLHKLGRH